MMLEFVWIQNYGVIENQGFNFNPNVVYSFDNATGELKKVVTQGIPEDFFVIDNNTVRSVSALVGANGTGKSTTLEFISSFLTGSYQKGGFVILENKVINKSNIEIKFSEEWAGKKPTIFNRLELINNYRKGRSGVTPLTPDDDTNSDPTGLRVLGNLITNTRIIHYSGEVNLEHTNRVFQSLLSLSDEFENSHYSDISDIALMAHDQVRHRTDKAVYSGENPILAYRSGESQRFIDLMISNYRNTIPFSLDNLKLNFRFSDIDDVFFESYDEMAFAAIMSLLLIVVEQSKIEGSEKTIKLIEKMRDLGLGGYFDDKLFQYENKNKGGSLKVTLYHHLLKRHIREQIMETMGELTEKNKLGYFLSLISDIEKSFLTGNEYLDQIKNYLGKTKFSVANTGSLNLKAIERFYKNIEALNLWVHDRFRTSLSDLKIIDSMLNALEIFDKESGVKYKISTIFDLQITGLSTGERQFLKIFSRFLAFKLNNESNALKEKTFIILIDEFDIGFHPLWQRKFLLTWIQFLESFVNKTINDPIKVQVILTSHSPFVVSDLPKQCINFLSKGEEEQHSKVDHLNKHNATFGANIHELYSDSFFLSGALMGEFAKRKIQEIFEWCQTDSQKDHLEIKRKISLIGEPIIRVKLAEMYAAKMKEDIEQYRIREQIDILTTRLKTSETK